MAVCLVLRPFQPAAEQQAILWVTGVVVAWAMAIEMSRSSALRQRGLVELRPVRHQGVERSAFLIPVCPHQQAAALLMVLFCDGVLFELFTRPLLCPDAFRDPLAVGLIAGLSLTIDLLGTGLLLRWIICRAHGLAFLPEGLLLSNGTVHWFIAWDWIERVARVWRRLAGTGYRFHSLGLRLTDVDVLPLTPFQRRWLKWQYQARGWHCLWPLGWCYALPLTHLVYLVSAYHRKPAERAKIGSEAGLADVRSALTAIVSFETTDPPLARAYS